MTVDPAAHRRAATARALLAALVAVEADEPERVAVELGEAAADLDLWRRYREAVR